MLLTVVVGSWLLPYASAFGERVYEANTVIGPKDPFFVIWSGESVAQSFTASSTYVLLNLTLRLRNTAGAGNAVNITVRPDATGVPSNAVLAWSIVQAGATVGPVNVPVTPSPTLTVGVLYWIVATKSGPLTQAYEWHHSGTDTYAGGKVMLNTGSGWTNPATATDMWFVNYGRELDANLSVAMTASPGMALPKDTITFTVYLNNTGTQAARTAWLNDTLPAGLTYLSDTAASISAVTGFPNYTFPSLGNGAHPFAITARVNVDVLPGTTLTNRATLAYTNATGVLKPSSSAASSVVVGLQWKQLYLIPGNPGPPQSLTPTSPTAGTPTVSRIQRGGAAWGFQLVNPLGRTFRAMNVSVVLYLDSASHAVKNLDIWSHS